MANTKAHKTVESTVEVFHAESVERLVGAVSCWTDVNLDWILRFPTARTCYVVEIEPNGAAYFTLLNTLGAPLATEVYATL